MKTKPPLYQKRFLERLRFLSTYVPLRFSYLTNDSLKIRNKFPRLNETNSPRPMLTVTNSFPQNATEHHLMIRSVVIVRQRKRNGVLFSRVCERIELLRSRLIKELSRRTGSEEIMKFPWNCDVPTNPTFVNEISSAIDKSMPISLLRRYYATSLWRAVKSNARTLSLSLSPQIDSIADRP